MTEDTGDQKEEDFLCTPYEFSNKSGKEVDYTKLIEQFGTRPITKELLTEFQRLTGEQPHILMRRGRLVSLQRCSSPTETCIFS